MDIIIVKIFMPTAIAFTIGILITPLISNFLYRYQFWKKKAGKGVGYGGGDTPVFDKLHEITDTGVPRMGGIVIWASVILTIVSIWILQFIFPLNFFQRIDFLSRTQTWLPLFALCVGAFVGLCDDLLVVRGTGKHFAGGLPLSERLLVVSAVAIFTAWWFYEKLDISVVNFIFFGPVDLGVWFIPFFVLVAAAIYAGGIIDGIDGLAGGVFLFIFSAYTGIAFFQNQIDLAAYCAAIVGGILAFLWFNIPPARFYMTETGIMALTMTLTTIVFMTDTLGEGRGVSVLPIVAFLLVLTVASDIVQVLSKKVRKKKVLQIAPIHHHFEALGWPGYKVTMRYWILGFIFAVVGMLIGVAL